VAQLLKQIARCWIDEKDFDAGHTEKLQAGREEAYEGIAKRRNRPSAVTRINGSAAPNPSDAFSR